MTWHVSTFYFFTSLQNLEKIETEIMTAGSAQNAVGLFILGEEGLNSTFATPSAEQTEKLKAWLQERFQRPNLFFKDSVSDIQPFPRLKVKIRPEIVTLGTPDLRPDNGHHRHLSPAEWDEVLTQDPNAVVLDTRNSYEYRIGTFKRALDPKIEQFTDFPEFVDRQNYDKDKKILIFCTGGIRCEKGILELERRGYQNVYQLEGGILNYLKERPYSQFEGECFVFDNRVAVDQELQASKAYKLCPHCGQPAKTPVQCIRCDSSAHICEDCQTKETIGQTCSKNCAHHERRSPGTKGRRQIPPYLQNSARGS